MDPDRDINPVILFIVIIIIVVVAGLFSPLREKIDFQLDKIRAEIYYRQNPPDEAVFVPQQMDEQIFTITPEYTATTESTPTTEPTLSVIEATETVIPTAEASATTTLQPTATDVPLPESFFIEGVRYEDQHGIWNYCAPTNLSMALNFWGWNGDRLTAGTWLKPFDKDKNVMFYEMEEFIAEQTGLRSVVRSGADAELIKKLLVNGFPVLVEKGAYMQEVSGALSWMGHYNLITGYDDSAQEWTVQDSYYTPDYIVSYELMEEEWRAFNYQFLIVYPGDKEADLFEVLGPYTNETWAVQHALEIADEAINREGNTIEDYYYAYFNRGTSLVDLQDYYGASLAYDEAFTYYSEFETSRRPYRMLWYQTGPYAAYYYSGRYYDIKNLAEITLASTAEPYLEETHYWRAMAELALEETGEAQEDLLTCLDLHPGFYACQSLLSEMQGG